MTVKRLILFLIIIFLGLNSVAIADERQKNPPDLFLKNTKAHIFSIKIINTFPHDPKAFTQGLLFYDGYLYESTGLNGKSTLRKVNIKSGKILQEFKLDQKYFAEGITISKNKIYQLTWQNNTILAYDLLSFKLLEEFSYSGEGWGIATDGKNLFMSNGTAVIDCIDPEYFNVVRKINVHDGKTAIGNLNELEFIRGEIWANIFMENFIVRISPLTGEVLGWVDLTSLYDLLPGDYRADVLNGIAYDQDNDRIFITGKLWPKIFEISCQ
ncbi:MAG: glutaminyl-peptide cyclotransferase [Deltaproteobacteria bacterium]